MPPRKAKPQARRAASPRGAAKPKAKAKAPARARGPSPSGAPAAGEALVPVLAVEDAAAAIAWYKRAFGATETERRLSPDGKVVHAELALCGGRLYLADVLPGAAADHPTALGGTTVRLHLHVQKVERAWARAVSEGAVVAVPLADQPWGERFGVLRDPFGHVWSMTRVPDASLPVRAPLPGRRVDASAGQLPP